MAEVMVVEVMIAELEVMDMVVVIVMVELKVLGLVMVIVVVDVVSGDSGDSDDDGSDGGGGDSPFVGPAHPQKLDLINGTKWVRIWESDISSPNFHKVEAETRLKSGNL